MLTYMCAYTRGVWRQGGREGGRETRARRHMQTHAHATHRAIAEKRTAWRLEGTNHTRMGLDNPTSSSSSSSSSASWWRSSQCRRRALPCHLQHPSSLLHSRKVCNHLDCFGRNSSREALPPCCSGRWLRSWMQFCRPSLTHVLPPNTLASFR